METSLEALAAIGLILATLANVAATQQLRSHPTDALTPSVRHLPAGAIPLMPPIAPAGFSDRLAFSKRNGPQP